MATATASTPLSGFLKASVAGSWGMNELALTHLQSGLASADWDTEQAVMLLDGWTVYLDHTLQRWAVYVDAPRRRVFVHADTWETVQTTDEATEAFVDDYVAAGKPQGLHFIVGDAGAYGRAARTQAAVVGTDGSMADRVSALHSAAESFVIQAASLNVRATRVQAQIFAVRYAELQAKLHDLEREVSEVRSLVDLAGTALVDATTG